MLKVGFAMKESKKISFAIKDKVLGEELTPSNLTLPLLSEFVEQVTTFLRGSGRPDLSEVKTSIKKGSLAVVVENPVGTLDDAFKDYQTIQRTKTLDFVDPVRARVVETWQKAADSSEDRIYELFFGEAKSEDTTLTISDETDYKASQETWVDVELYLYGRIYDLGGKNKPNVHLELENGKSIRVGTKASILLDDNENRLYKDQLVRIKAKRNIATKELKDERLISFEHYDPTFDQDEYDKIAKKAQIAWQSVKNPTGWVESLRGNSV